MKRELSADSPDLVQLRALLDAAVTSNSDLTQLIAYDDAGRVLSIGVVARGEDAVALDRFLKRRAKREQVELPDVPLATPRRCTACHGTGRLDHGYCSCRMGKDLERVETRDFVEPTGDAL